MGNIVSGIVSNEDISSYFGIEKLYSDMKLAYENSIEPCKEAPSIPLLKTSIGVNILNLCRLDAIVGSSVCTTAPGSSVEPFSIVVFDWSVAPLPKSAILSSLESPPPTSSTEVVFFPGFPPPFVRPGGSSSGPRSEGGAT